MSILPYFYDIDVPLRLMDRGIFRPNFFNSPLRMSRDFFGPSYYNSWENALPCYQLASPMEELSKRMTQLGLKDIGLNEDDEKFQVNIDVQHFSPEEISVKVVEGQVVVEGNHEEKHDEHGYVSRRFVRKYALPKGCLPDTVQSKLSSDGVLIISAPKVLPMPSIGERIIPITQTGPVQKQSTSESELNTIDESAGAETSSN